MSIISDFFDNILNTDSQDGQSSSYSTHPCANCPSDCTIAGAACEICSPYKKKLIDTIYYVDHLDEFRAQYEVTGLTGASSAITCPYCGAQTQNHMVCEYCGSKLSEDSGKIKVASASDIPNPVMQAQDIIFERFETVIKQYSAGNSGASDDKGILDQLLSAFTGADDSDSDRSSLGAKMSEAEISEAASLYGVSVSEYLTGLDNGKYLTLAGRKAAASAGLADSFAPASSGITGLAGIGLFTGLLLNNSSHYNRPYSHYAPAYHKKPAPHSEPVHHKTPEPRDDHARPQRPAGALPSQSDFRRNESPQRRGSRDARDFRDSSDFRRNESPQRRDSRDSRRNEPSRRSDSRRNEPSRRSDSRRDHGGPGGRR